MKAKVKVQSGKSRGGTLLASTSVRIAKPQGNQKPAGSPLFKSKAQLNLHLDRGKRPEKTQFRGTS